MPEVRKLDWRPAIHGAFLVAYATSVALSRGTARWILAAPLVLAPIGLWVLQSPNAWLNLFFAAALLLPPLPIDLGNSGPHPALAFAALGVAIGFVRMSEWRFRRGVLPGVLVLLPAVLVVSVALAAIYSGEGIAIISLARVGLSCISVYVFFYVSAGPGRAGGISPQFLYWVALVSAAFACVDFYYQFPAPAGFGPQYVWLDSGVYRRAQGLFYEAGTLGNFCAFFLVMTAVALARRVGNRVVLLAGGAVFAAAMIFSYSRSSVLNVGVALTALVALESSRLQLRRLLTLISAALVGGALLVHQAFPAFADVYWNRIWFSATQIFSSSDRILTGRVESWRTLTHFLAQNPWHAIFGVGYKTLPYSNFIGQPVVADNMYLSLLVETGIVGLGTLLVLNFAILRAGYAAARSGDPEKSFYGTWIFCFWAGQMVQMLSVDLLTFWRVLPLYLWVLAMAIRK